MTRLCKNILKEMRRMEKSGNAYPFFTGLSKQLSVPVDDITRACAYLNEHKRLEYMYPCVNGVRIETPERVTLTLRGKYPVQYAFGEILGYLAENWISLVALAISIAAFYISISKQCTR